ncbi:MAG: DUF2148 domain-containing protein [Candidatus Margulisiibacteriota bacterium]
MEKVVLRIAEEMCLAAKTAPKGKGIDLLAMCIVSGADIKKLSNKMKEIGDREKHPTFLRDSENILSANAVVVLGTKKQTIGLKYCSFCGYENCAAAEKAGALCAFNPGDLGIAVGSAVSVAMDHRVDNRIMYSVGKAAIELGLLGKETVIAYGIPLSASGKNPFFDRR